MTETRWKPQGKWIVQAIDHKFPTPDESAAPKRWRSFSPKMWSFYLGFIRSLQQPILWQDWTGNLYEILSEYMLPEEPPETECPEPPPPPPPPPPPAGGSSGSSAGIVGASGLSVFELEALLVMSVTRIEWNPDGLKGGLYVKYFGCCDWELVPGMAGLVQTSATKPADEMTWEEWIAGDHPPLPDSGTIEHQNPAYTTTDSLACAKATALVNELWTWLELKREILFDAENHIDTLSWIQGLMVTYLSGGSLTTIYAMVVALYDHVTDGATTAHLAALDAVILDSGLKEELICTLVPLMASITQVGAVKLNKVTDNDVNNLLHEFHEATDALDSGILRVADQLPVMVWKQRVMVKLLNTECGCDEYLPYGYTPPSPSDGFNISFMRFAKGHGAGINVDFSPIPTTDLEAGLDPSHGTRVGQDYRSAYTGVNNGYQYTALGVLFEASEPFTLSGLEVSWEQAQESQQKWRAFAWDGDVWLPVNGGTATGADPAGTYGTDIDPAENIAGVTHIWIGTWAQGFPQNSGNVPYNLITEVRFDGVVESTATGFVGLKDNEPLEP